MTDTRRKIVPVEATMEITKAGIYEYSALNNNFNSSEVIVSGQYRAMLAASPDASEDDEFVRALESAAHKAIMECNAFDPQSQAKAATSAILKTIEGTPND